MLSDTVPQTVVDEFVGAAHGDFDTVKALLAAHPSLLAASASWGETALGAAAQVGRPDIAEFLLEAGAALDICTAAMLGRVEQVKARLRADPASARATGAHGIPVMYHAAIRGNIGIAEILLAHGAEVNAGAGGSPAIHGAVTFKQPEMVGWLLAHRADVNALDYEGKTPLARALARGFSAIADLLRRNGGQTPP